MTETGQMTSQKGEPSRRVLFLPDNPHDAEVAAAIFGEYDIQICPVDTLSSLVDEAHQGAGCLLLVEERLHSPDVVQLLSLLENQPEWSDLPVIITIRNGSASPRASRLTTVANVTLIERPLSIRTLISLVQSALRDRQRQYEIRQSIDNRDHFLAMVSHELRNPLTAISLATQILDDSNDRAIDIIKRQVLNLERILNDLREVSQVSQGNISYQKVRQDLVDLLGETLDAFAPIAAGKNLTLGVDWPDHPLWIDGDPGRLGQVLGNLLSNAIRYTPEGGRIDIQARSSEEFVLVIIRDTGIGIPADKQDEIFDLFTQAHDGRKSGNQGMGLGLNLASNIVQAHHGDLIAESAGEGKGATFTLRLPTAEPPTTADEDHHPSPP